MADDVTITVHVRDLTGPGFNSVSRNLNQLQRQANQMGGSLRIVGGQLDNVANAASNAGSSLGGGMGLKGQAIGAAAALGTALLPTIGALAPMLTGLAVVGGGAALAMDDLKEKAKQLKKPFEEWQKVAEKAVAPHTEKAVKSLKGAMKDLTPVIEVGAETFGRITEKAARFADSPAFKGVLAKNAQMGAQWVEEFAGSLGRFTQAFLDFGTKSKPALDAWQNLLGGLLDTGLPSMFKEMEQGIGGSSKFLNGLAYVINDGLLPALGKIAGSFAEAFGPLLGEMLRTTGDLLRGIAVAFEGAMEVIEPLAHFAADAWGAFAGVLQIASEAAGSLAKSVGGALMGALLAVAGVDTSKPMRGVTAMSDWVREHEGSLRAGFYAVAEGITSMVMAGVSMLPELWAAFRMTSEAVLVAVDGIVSGFAAAFGDLPGIGDTFKNLNSRFDDFASKARSGLDNVGAGVNRLADEALPRLSRAKLVMNVDQARQNLASVKKQLEDPSLTKERRAKLTADKEAAEDALAKARAGLDAYDRKRAEAKLGAKDRASSVILGVGARLMGLNGRTATTYVTTHYRITGNRNIPSGTYYGSTAGRSADGNIYSGRAYANGGMEQHVAQIAQPTFRIWAEPETGGESYIPLSPSKRPRSRQIAEQTVGILGGQVEWFAKGGMSKAQKDARHQLGKSFGISHFGRIAGYQRDPFEKALGNPQDLGALVSSLNQLHHQIKAAFSGKQESNLLKSLDKWGKSLIRWEKELASVTKSLDKAKSKLSELKSAASQLAASVKGGVLSSANITRGAQGDAPVTVASIMGGLTASRDKATAFAGALKQLQAKGLSSSLLQQIAEAGIEGGGLETAGALLSASKSEIASMNSLQSQITKAAGAAGKTAADAVYGGAIKWQEKLISRLGQQQERLTKSMDKLAKAMERVLQQALKGKAAGGIVGMAAAGGIRSNLTWVGEQGPELLDLPAGSRVWSNPDSRRMAQAPWASMLNAPRRAAATSARAAAVAGGGDGQPIVIQLRLADRDFGEVWVDVGRKKVRAFGSIEATLQPPRGR